MFVAILSMLSQNQIFYHGIDMDRLGVRRTKSGGFGTWKIFPNSCRPAEGENDDKPSDSDGMYPIFQIHKIDKMAICTYMYVMYSVI